MISQLPGACFRALLVVVTILMPSLLLPEQTSQVIDTVLLVAIFAALFVLVEYGATCPSLLEFRDAPPFNRVRFGLLFGLLALTSIALADGVDASPLGRLLFAVGALLGHATDLPFSPVRLVLWLVPETATPVQVQAVRATAGLSYLVGLVGLTIFAILIRLRRWPCRGGSFNVWINLPTFGQTAGADVARGLRRDGAVNILLGILLPYVAPLIAVAAARFFGVSMLDSDLMLVWMMSLWAFLPAALFLRGIAMRRLALLISRKRRRIGAADGTADPAFLPA